MVLSTGIIFGILTMFSWGISDFLAKNLVEKIGAFRAFIYSYIIGVIPLVIWSFFYPQDIALTKVFVIVLLLGAFLNFLGYLFLYKGLSIEKVSVLSPIVACNPVIIILLSFIFLNEILNLSQGAGIALLVIGLILTTIQSTKFKIHNKKGVLYGFLTMLSWGIAIFILGFLVKESSWLFPVLMFRALTWFYGFVFFNLREVPLKIPKKTAIITLIVFVGLLDMLGTIFYGLGSSKDLISVVGPIAALYPAVTLVLARLFIKERLIPVQKIGVIIILAGLVIISL